MSVMHILCNSHSRFCEAYTAVSLVVYMTALIQPLKHFGHARRADVEVIRDINCSGIALLGYQLINDFKVILHAGRPANLLSVVGITYELEAIPAAARYIVGLILEFPCQLHYLRDLYNNKYYIALLKNLAAY